VVRYLAYRFHEVGPGRLLSEGDQTSRDVQLPGLLHRENALVGVAGLEQEIRIGGGSPSQLRPDIVRSGGISTEVDHAEAATGRVVSHLAPELGGKRVIRG